VVSEKETYDYLLANSYTVWILKRSRRSICRA